MAGAALKEALRTRRRTIGSWVTFADEAPAEIMARAGFDWLVLDMEHAPLDVPEAARLIRIIDLAGVPAICRLPSNDPVMAKRVLDAGAAGIMVPGVRTAEEARQAVAAASYPPAGTRGVGLARAQDYGGGLERYRERMPKTLVVIAMIEHREGVEAAAEIARVPGLDGLFIGPYDLSASLGRIGQVHHPDVRAAASRVVKAARAAGIGCGLHLVHPTASAARDAMAAGYTCLALGVDMIFLDTAARAAVALAARTTRPDRLRAAVTA